jgi:signal transduction histidine kinase/HPt (histidine-containing phosphotransfer) domain-containing protein
MSKRILIVEDSATEALRARLILEQQGYRVDLAPSGQEGLSRAAKEGPDLVVLDGIMPRMSGYEAYQRLRVDPQTVDIPVLMLLTGVRTQETPCSLGRGGDFYIGKPYDPALLLAGVKAATAGTNGHQGGREGAGGEGEIEGYREALARARQEAQEARRAKSEFLATMSHEFRTPLHEIMGMTDLALDTELTPEQRTYLTTAKTSANTLLAIIGDILEYAELEAGQLELASDRFGLWDTVEKTMDIMVPHAREKGLELDGRIAPNVVKEALGDPVRLRQVLTNLIGNAIRFTEQGEVFVEVAQEADDGREVELHFTVRDTGIGIPEDKQAVIFDTFRQADGSTTRQYGSIGLGLAMSKQLVELMGGRIWVESRVGQGSAFHFAVRLARPSEEMQAGQERKPIPSQLRILVVEDSPTNQLIARANLEKAGHLVHVVENGRKAVEAWKNGVFDLVLMDIAMPEMDGVEATCIIRGWEEVTGGHVPIVAMTAFAMQEYRERAMQAGMDAYVTKPVSPHELRRAIEPLLLRAPRRPAKGPARPAPVDLEAALGVVDGDVEVLRAVVEMFLAECDGQVAALSQAVAQGDASAVESTAHALKGVVSNVGGVGAGATAGRLEAMGASGDLGGAPAALGALEAEMARVRAFYSRPGWEQEIERSE